MIPITKPYIGREEEEVAKEAIRSGWVSQGPKVREFEKRFAGYIGAKHAAATASCTTALHLALIVSGVKLDDEVLIPSLSFIATANAVTYCGAKPVFVDIDPSTCNIDTSKIEEAITKKTKAIMPVHQMGLPADIDRIKEIADKHGLAIIEDAACAVGSEYKGKKIGGHGNIACFSFHPRKIITTGEGGMITTDDEFTADRLRKLRQHSMSVSDLERHKNASVIIEEYPEIGYNYRMTDIQAAIGIVQLKRIEEIISKRRNIASYYNKEFSNIPYIGLPKVPKGSESNFQSYWIEFSQNAPINRETFMRKLLDLGIATRRGIMAIHMEKPYYKNEIHLPVTIEMTNTTVLLPIFPSMTTDEQKCVVSAAKQALGI